MVRWLTLLVAVCLAAVLLGPSSWAGDAVAVRLAPAEPCATALEEGRENNEADRGETQGPLPSESSPDPEELLSGEDATEPACVAIAVEAVTREPHFEALELGPADGHRRGMDRPPRA